MSQHYFECSDLTYDDILDRFDEALKRETSEPEEIFLEIVKSGEYLAILQMVPLMPKKLRIIAVMKWILFS